MYVDFLVYFEFRNKQRVPSLYFVEPSLIVVQKEFEEGGKLHGKRVYLFGCTERKYSPSYG
jgi:hypothetical protein